MSIRALLTLALLAFAAPLFAQKCQYFGEEAANAFVKSVADAPTCSAAVARLHECQWGSTADLEPASVAIDKCEKTFLDKLSPAAKNRYKDEMELCSYRYEHQQGTMSRSAAAICAADVAESTAKNPAALNNPAPRASFDCTKAQSTLEKAICSDPQLGRADIVLARVYTEALQTFKKQRAQLIDSQKQWLRQIPVTCKLGTGPASQPSLECLRREWEVRFTNIDSCVEDVITCLAREEEKDRDSASK